MSIDEKTEQDAQNTQVENPSINSGQAQKPKINRGPTLRIIPLGGMEEVGRNMTVFEYEKDIVILDMGIQFPEEDMPGIDYIIPSISYLKGKEKNIRAVIFSHGHLDHIGAAPLLLPKLGYPPVVGKDLTIAMIKKRMEDFSKGSAKKLDVLRINSVNDMFDFGKFRIGFFNVEHSIVDAIGVIINTPLPRIRKRLQAKKVCQSLPIGKL